MFHHPQTIFSATKIILREKTYRVLFLPLFIIFFSFFVSIPAITIPSNTFQFQLTLYTRWDYVMLVILATLGSLFVLMNVYTFRQVKESKERLRVVARGGVGSISGTFASIFGAASCPMCVASLFGFLGFGTVGFLIQNQGWVFFAASVLMLVSLYFASRKANDICEQCR